jgi:squalene-associated FAD-dependent desaturase
MSSKSVIVIGGGLAGLSCAVALADAGVRVRLLEQRPFLGGRASSYLLPGGEHVDNCQHVTLGCCTNLQDFYARVGAAQKITYYDRLVFVDGRGRRGAMKAGPLPPPLHLAPSLAFYPGLGWSDRRAIARAMLTIARRGGRNGGGDADGKTMKQWLRLHGQPPAALARFWEVVLVSALNEELDRIDARYGLDVFWKAFLANRAGYRLGIPGVPLGDLYDGCRDALERRRGEVRLRAGVQKICVANGRVSGVATNRAGEELADAYVLAAPYDRVLHLLPMELVEREPFFGNLRRLRAAPIIGVHFWLDREVMTEPFLTLLDRTTQWVFNKSRLYGGTAEGQYLQLVISAAYTLIPRSRQEIIDLCLDELRGLLPAVREAKLLKATVVKETAATFSPEPGSDAWRPPQRTPLPNLFLAGDWTATGWPATMEGAVRSGYLAAEAFLEAAGAPHQLLRPDLPVEGLARRWANRSGRN